MSELFISPKTEVDNFADQLEHIVTSALDAICPAKICRVRFSRRQRSQLPAEASMTKRRRLDTLGCINSEEFRQCCRDTNQLINESRRQLLSSRLGHCVNARQRWSAIRKLLYYDNNSICIDDDVSFCNMFTNFFVSKICNRLATHLYSTSSQSCLLLPFFAITRTNFSQGL